MGCQNDRRGRVKNDVQVRHSAELPVKVLKQVFSAPICEKVSRYFSGDLNLIFDASEEDENREPQFGSEHSHQSSIRRIWTQCRTCELGWLIDLK